MLERLWLRIDGPFAAFRTFTAGWYRPSAPFMTHSAAYGLFLNLAGIESRLWEGEEGHDGKTPASLERDALPQARIALGIPAGMKPPVVQTLYQQLHNYLQDPARQNEGYQRGKGAKFNITPVRREFLWKFHAIAVIESSPDLIRAIRRGLRVRNRTGVTDCRFSATTTSSPTGWRKSNRPPRAGTDVLARTLQRNRKPHG